LHPVAILAVDALATNFNLNLVDKTVTNIAHPAETVSGRITKTNLGENNLNIRLVHKVSVTVDHSRYTLVEVSLTVERHLNGLHGEVRVALVKDLPERDLGITGDIDILRTIRHKLHKTATHVCLYLTVRKKY